MIRWGIIGAGKIAHKFAADFQFLENATLMCIASSDDERAKEFAAQYDIPFAMSYEELYHSPEIDAVYIATTHNFHFEQAMMCLQNHKAVLCEKPITVNAQQIEQLIHASLQNNTFLMEAMWTYFLPAVQQAKTWINDGRIGAIKVLQIEFSFPAPKIDDGRIYNANLAGGALLDIGIYPIAMAYFFIDKEPLSIIASGQLSATGIDERVGMFLEYGDASASLYASIVTRMTNSAKIYGTDGYIEIPLFWKSNEAKLFDADDQLIDTFHDHRSSFGYHYEMQHANDLIQKNEIESPIVSHQRSLDIQRTMDEVRRQIGLKYPFE